MPKKRGWPLKLPEQEDDGKQNTQEESNDHVEDANDRHDKIYNDSEDGQPCWISMGIPRHSDLRTSNQEVNTRWSCRTQKHSPECFPDGWVLCQQSATGNHHASRVTLSEALTRQEFHVQYDPTIVWQAIFFK